MSDTNKDKWRGKIKRMNIKNSKEWQKVRRKLLEENPDSSWNDVDRITDESDPYKIYPCWHKWKDFDYAHGPSWHNLMFNRVWRRRHDRDLCKKVTLDILDPDKEEYLDFTDDDKPYEYYY